MPSSDGGGQPDKPVLNVGITSDNRYLLTEDVDKFYSYEEIEPIIISKMKGDLTDNDIIKISGDKDADYQYVFKLIALAKDNEWKPILVFE